MPNPEQEGLQNAVPQEPAPGRQPAARVNAPAPDVQVPAVPEKPNIPNTRDIPKTPVIPRIPHM